MAGESAHFPSVFQVPQPKRLIGAGGQGALSVRRQGDAPDPVTMPFELLFLFAGVTLPQAQDAIGAAGGDRTAVGSEGNRIDRSGMAPVDADFLAGHSLPKAY